MKRPKWLLMSALALGLLSASVAGHAALTAASDAKVSFAASANMGMSFVGKTSELTVADDGANVVVTVPLAHVTTDIGMRDQHMKDEYLEVAKFPSTTLTIARSALKFPAPGADVTADVPGTLTLHGQTKPVTVHYTAKGAPGAIDVQGTLRVNTNDYAIPPASRFGVTVKPDIDVSASFHVAGN